MKNESSLQLADVHSWSAQTTGLIQMFDLSETKLLMLMRRL